MKWVNFRVFDRVTNKMIEIEELGWVLGNLHTFKGITGGKGGWNDVHKGSFNERIVQQDKRQPRFILLQYTGLKDKNGTEIYEGDIIDAGSIHKGYVVYRGASFTEEPIRKKDKPYWAYRPFGNLDMSKREVIGNIYENPELLEVE